jgi:Domain of unknown function (DUF4365)
MSSSPRVRQTRKAERAAVNAVRALLEEHNLVFQEVDQSNDYGKDAYVDLTADREVSGQVIALQIKGGSKYVRASGYAIPCDREHGGFWFNSSLPVIGIVQDPRSQGLYWENLTRYLREVDSSPTSTPIPSTQTLTSESLKAFVDEMARYLRSYAGSRWLDLASSDPNRQAGAALDCFAIGRFDSRGLILLRGLLARLSGEGFKAGTHLLAHATPHPDIFWTKQNWISEPIKKEVRRTLLWQPSELRQLLGKLAEIEDEETWGRGTLGQSLYSLFVEDPAIDGKLEDALRDAVRAWEDEIAYQLFFIAVYRSGEGARDYCIELTRRFPRLLQDARVREIRGIVEEFGCIDIF